MNDDQYLTHCKTQLSEFSRELQVRTEHLPEQDTLRSLAAAFGALAEGELDLYTEGPALISRLFTTYPDFAPTFPRDLLWFFGGDCLHFMPDHEIAIYQQLDDLRSEASAKDEILNLRAARASIGALQ